MERTARGVQTSIRPNLDDLKRRIRTEWANLVHAVIAAAVRQWRRLLSAYVRAAAVISNTAFNPDVVFL